MTVPIPETQRAAARFLADAAGRTPIETHVSAVFVGPDTVWKMKKAVLLPYLDFRTLTARREDLARELALNQPAAPDLYRDVVPLRRLPDGSLALGDGRGEVVEWVLRMAPIAATDFFDRIAAEGRFTIAMARALGRAIARYHKGLVPLSGVAHLASLERLTLETVHSAWSAGCDATTLARWQEAMRPALTKRAAWFDERARAGFVRRAHGDLHLRNICLWHGEPTPFDALEFDERLARIDLSFDLAFLLMDCELRVGRGAANAVLTSYVGANGDADVVGGLAPFLSLRAMTRAHVEKASRNAAMARAYLAAAIDYLTLPPPALVAVGGLPGSGKSTLAHALAPALGAAPGALVLSSDVVRKRHHGVSPEARLPASAYTPAAGRRVATELLAMAARALGLGHAVILDATFLDPDFRSRAAEVAAAAKAPFLGLWLEAPLDVLTARIETRAKQPLADPSDATPDVLRRFARAAVVPDASWPRVAERTPEATRESAEHLLKRELAGSIWFPAKRNDDHRNEACRPHARSSC